MARFVFALLVAVAAWPMEVRTVLADADSPPSTDEFKSKIRPFLTTHCISCHNGDKNAGGVNLDTYLSEAHARKDRKAWEAVREQMANGTMPPKKKAQPTAAEKDTFLNWIDQKLLKIDCTAPKDPGRVTLRRLNRAEYNATIRDLCGVKLTPADDFPADDVGYGFDNIGDVLSIQPVLLEKYMAAADRVLEAALPPLPRIEPAKQTYRPQQLLASPRSAKIREVDPKTKREIFHIKLTDEGSTFIEKYNFEGAGEYAFRIRAWGQKVGDEYPKMVLRVDGKEIKSFTVQAVPDKRELYDVKAKMTAGEKRVAVAFVNPFHDKNEKDEKKNSRTLGVEMIEIEGPLGGTDRPVPESTQRILAARPSPGGLDKTEAARQSLTKFARKAFRRPTTTAEIDRLMKLFAIADGKGEPFNIAMRLPLKAVLVSPNFLFRIEEDPKDPNSNRLLNDHELASRLSYFLWSSMPDEELSAIADRGELRKPGVLKGQVERMLKDPKIQAMTDNFASQWLQLRDLWNVSPDTGRFPTWDEELRRAMIREGEMFFTNILKEDRSVLEFIDADYTFLNARLARHYGIPNIRGSEFRKVKLTDGRRGGILTQAGFLTLTSNPTRTSPVKRGKWVYENILGLTAPPPAPDVPQLPAVGQFKGTLRQQMEQHRSNPSCATCHVKLDPLGFGLENFDAIGAWRSEENQVRIDSSGVLPDGSKFDGPGELRKVLMAKADQFRRCLCEKMLTYAIGRGLEYYDKCTVDELVTKLKGPGHDHFSALIQAVVETDAFQKRAGKRSE
ncbi:MAG: DUF1592 domain-containing protein [Gemmataceae bacterium]